MTLKIKSILSLLLAFLLTFAACSAAPHKERVQPPMSERILQIAQGMKKLAGVEEGDCLLNASDEFPAGSSVCDWAALACAVGGAEDSYTAYLHALEAYVKNKLGEDSSLGRATDYHRIALTVLALGGDPAAFSEDKNGEPVNLIEFGTYNYPGELGAQGLNAYIFALITLDSESYTVPDGSRYTRTSIIKEILAAEEPDGGFGLDKGAFDIDITAMALQALAPYYGSQNALSVGISPGEISRTVDRALARLASVMKENCTFCSYGAENTESTAQVIIALCSLGIDPRTDERFMRGGKNIVDGMQSFLLPGSVYRHSANDSEGNLMSTEQAMLAHIALYKADHKLGRLYDFSKSKA